MQVRHEGKTGGQTLTKGLETKEQSESQEEEVVTKTDKTKKKVLSKVGEKPTSKNRHFSLRGSAIIPPSTKNKSGKKKPRALSFSEPEKPTVPKIRNLENNPKEDSALRNIWRAFSPRAKPKEEDEEGFIALLTPRAFGKKEKKSSEQVADSKKVSKKKKEKPTCEKKDVKNIVKNQRKKILFFDEECANQLHNEIHAIIESQKELDLSDIMEFRFYVEKTISNRLVMKFYSNNPEIKSDFDRLNLSLFEIQEKKAFKYGKIRKFSETDFAEEGFIGEELENLEKKKLKKVEKISLQEEAIEKICKKRRDLFLKGVFARLNEGQESYQQAVQEIIEELNSYTLLLMKDARYQEGKLIGISKVNQYFDGVSNFIVNCILSENNHKKRKQLYVFFIDVASAFRGIGDFFNSRAFMSGLQSVCIERTLRVSESSEAPPELDEEQMKKREGLVELFSFRFNQINLRNAQNEVQEILPRFILDLTLLKKDIFMLGESWKLAKDGGKPLTEEEKEKDVEPKLVGFRETMKNVVNCQALSQPPKFAEILLVETFNSVHAFERSTKLRKRYIKSHT